MIVWNMPSSMYDDIMAGNVPNLSNNNQERRCRQILMNNSRFGWSLISKYSKLSPTRLRIWPMQWTRLMFLWLSGETFDLLPAGVNCLGVWSLFKSQVFSPQFFINVFYQVLQLKCHCFYDGSAYQGKCFQIGLLKFVNFWNILNKGHGQFIERKKEIFFQTFEKYR